MKEGYYPDLHIFHEHLRAGPMLTKLNKAFDGNHVVEYKGKKYRYSGYDYQSRSEHGFWHSLCLPGPNVACNHYVTTVEDIP